jgi:hypothetical protein
MTTDTDLEHVRQAYPEVEDPSPDQLALLRARLVERIDASVTSREPEPRLRRTPALRRRLVLGATALAAAAGIAIAVINSGSAGPNQATMAEARVILRGAAAGLTIAPGGVLHYADTSVETFRHGHTTRYRSELWGETSFPYDERNILSPAGQPSQEWAVIHGIVQLYDPQRNTIYTNQPPGYTIRPAPRAGHYLLTPTDDPNPPTIEITAARLRALRDGQDTMLLKGKNRVAVVSYRSIAHTPFDARKQALALLHSRHARVLNDARFAGQTAIEISGTDPLAPIFHESYYVTPKTYKPLGLVTRLTGETITARFTVFQVLRGTTTNRALVTLTGAHPTARIDTSAADYNAASKRLQP